MHSLKRLLSFPSSFIRSQSLIPRHLSTCPPAPPFHTSPSTGLEEWNDAVSQPDRAPCESQSREIDTKAVSGDCSADLDGETKAFVAEVVKGWKESRVAKKVEMKPIERMKEKKERGKRKNDKYKLKKQRKHANEIEKLEEPKHSGGIIGDAYVEEIFNDFADIYEYDSDNESGEEDISVRRMVRRMETRRLFAKCQGWSDSDEVEDWIMDI